MVRAASRSSSRRTPRLPFSIHRIISTVIKIISTVTKNYRYMRGQEFFVLTRRERRAYPSAVCKERATRSARKRTAALWVAPHWAWGVVAPQSQNAGGYAPSSRLAPGPMRRNACIDNSVSQYEPNCLHRNAETRRQRALIGHPDSRQIRNATTCL